MCASDIPLFAAVVAAPARKLCPENPSGLCPDSVIAFLSSTTNVTLVRGAPEENWNSGPGALPLFTSHVKSAATGHKSLLVRWNCISTPSLNGSVFDAFMVILIACGLRMSSTATS